MHQLEGGLTVNLIEKTLMRAVLKPRIIDDRPGTCVLQMGALSRLPVNAEPRLHYIKDALALLPWVKSSQVDSEGKITVSYSEGGSADKVKRWLDTAVETAISLSDTMDMRNSPEKAIVEAELSGLKPLVSKFL